MNQLLWIYVLGDFSEFVVTKCRNDWNLGTIKLRDPVATLQRDLEEQRRELAGHLGQLNMSLGH